MLIIIREIIVFTCCLLILPLVLIILVLQGDSSGVSQFFLSREMLAGGCGPGGTSLILWMKLVLPYLGVQAVRGYLWAKRSSIGRKWVNLYFTFLLASIGGWSFLQAWDLFYFMYALDDIPAEIPQFFELEGHNVIIAVASFVSAAYCFRIFVDPTSSESSQTASTACRTRSDE